MSRVIGIVGGSGGVGTSTLAAAFAALAAPSLLVDLDPIGGGLDVTLGIESVPGARWSGLRVAGGHLDPQALVSGLPRWGQVAVLAADVPSIEPGTVAQVLDAAAQTGPVVLDLPRAPIPERAPALSRCDLVVVLVRSDVGALVAAHALVVALGAVPTGLIARRGDVPAAEAARLVGCPLLGELPPLGAARAELHPSRVPRSTRRVVLGVLRGLTDTADGDHTGEVGAA